MRELGLFTLWVKDQGVAQCYLRPLWRTSGDGDFLLSEDKMAKGYLLSQSSDNKKEERYSRHLGLIIGPWYVEILGTMRTGLSTRTDKEIDFFKERFSVEEMSGLG